MKIPFKKSFASNSEVLLRHCGYARQSDYKTEQISYFKRLGETHFPKFHVYVERESPLILTIHLDQKAHTYGDKSAHLGEYEGENVRNEAYRIWQEINLKE